MVTFDTKLFLSNILDYRFVFLPQQTNQVYLIVLFAVNLAILAQILAVKNALASFALETGNMPMLVQRNQCLTIGYLSIAGVTY